MRIAIIYHSESGNTKEIADLIAAGAKAAGDIEAKTMSIDETDDSFVETAHAVILGSPTYIGGCSWQIKRWLDTTKAKLAGKLGAVFSTAGFLGGGAEAGEIIMISGLLVRGMLLYSGGVSGGQPFTHFGTTTINKGDEAQQERARVFGTRVAAKALELWGAPATEMAG